MPSVLPWIFASDVSRDQTQSEWGKMKKDWIAEMPVIVGQHFKTSKPLQSDWSIKSYNKQALKICVVFALVLSKLVSQIILWA